MSSHKKAGNFRSIIMFMVCMLLSSGCKSASSGSSSEPSPTPTDTSPPVSAKDEPPAVDIRSAVSVVAGQVETLAADTVASDGLFYNGFIGYSETYTNQLNVPVQIHAQIVTSSILLITQLQESANMQGRALIFTKGTQVDLTPSDLRIIRGEGQTVSFVNGAAVFTVNAGESLGVRWMLRASTSANLCPFRAHESFPNTVMPNLSSSLQMVFAASNLIGSFTRSVQASLNLASSSPEQAGASVSLISNQVENFNQIAGVLQTSNVRPYLCNGLLQKLPDR